MCILVFFVSFIQKKNYLTLEVHPEMHLFIYFIYLLYIHIVTYATLDFSNYILQNYNTCTKSQTVTIIM